MLMTNEWSFGIYCYRFIFVLGVNINKILIFMFKVYLFVNEFSNFVELNNSKYYFLFEFFKLWLNVIIGWLWK